MHKAGSSDPVFFLPVNTSTSKSEARKRQPKVPIDYAKQKVKSIIETIEFIRELDFPYEHPREAVNFIHNLFKKLLSHLNRISDPNSARAMCRLVSKIIDDFLLAIGFMVRACDIRGPLELHGPLLRLTRRAIGSHVKLVVFSEWRFSPFTELYPGEFGDRFVLVGLPVSEAGNPLIAPLAGHELGHNIWRRLKNFKEFVGEQIKNKVAEIIKSEPFWGKFVTAFKLSRKEQLDQDELFDGVTPWQVARMWGVSHCEEMFCDFIGLCIFGEGYLHAFQYLASPGGGLRNSVYPGMRDRINALLQASKTLNLEIPLTFEEEFDESDVSSDLKQQLLLEVSDKASQALVSVLIETAEKLCSDKGIISRDTNDVHRICESFRKVIPATEAKSLANIKRRMADLSERELLGKGLPRNRKRTRETGRVATRVGTEKLRGFRDRKNTGGKQCLYRQMR